MTNTINAQDTKQLADESKSKSERQKLIVGLKMIGQTIASNDKNKIADIFEFPLLDKSFSIYIDDKTYYEQLQLNGNKTTKEMFLQYYKEIFESIWLDQLNNLFRNISIDSLLYKDTMEYQAYIATEPCFYSYQIEIVENSIVLRMDMNSNKNYQTKTLSEDDIPENSSEICEHNFWWNFKFDGNKLHLESISGAG